MADGQDRGGRREDGWSDAFHCHYDELPARCSSFTRKDGEILAGLLFIGWCLDFVKVSVGDAYVGIGVDPAPLLLTQLIQWLCH